jgi:hypothetical protein
MKINENVCKKLSVPAYWNSISKPTLFTYLEHLAQTTKDSLQKDKIQSQYVSELTIIKRSYKEMDEQYNTVVEALGNFAVSQLFVSYSRIRATIIVWHSLCCLIATACGISACESCNVLSTSILATAMYMKGYGSVE